MCFCSERPRYTQRKRGKEKQKLAGERYFFIYSTYNYWSVNLKYKSYNKTMHTEGTDHGKYHFACRLFRVDCYIMWSLCLWSHSIFLSALEVRTKGRLGPQAKLCTVSSALCAWLRRQPPNTTQTHTASVFTQTQKWNIWEKIKYHGVSIKIMYHSINILASVTMWLIDKQAETQSKHGGFSYLMRPFSVNKAWSETEDQFLSCWKILSFLNSSAQALAVAGVKMCLLSVRLSHSCWVQYLKNTLREFRQIWHICPLELKDELIRFWWLNVKDRGQCELTNYIFGSKIHITTFYTNA